MRYAVKVMPRRRSMSLSAIAAAALAVVDRDGIASLSMRAVAAQLGTGTMSLYRYVESREQLERAIVELLLANVDLQLPPAADWQLNIVTLLKRVRSAVGAHPAAVPLLLTQRHLTGGSVLFAETLFGELTRGGFCGSGRVIAFRTLLSFVLGSLQYQHLGPLGGDGTAALAQLPDAEFPLLAETARAGLRVSPDDEFNLGLWAILRGLRPDHEMEAAPHIEPPSA
ncbi:MAG: TetR/AcrR family transcriptional regulator [Chloroflexota bacterium]